MPYLQLPQPIVNKANRLDHPAAVEREAVECLEFRVVVEVAVCRGVAAVAEAAAAVADWPVLAARQAEARKQSATACNFH